MTTLNDVSGTPEEVLDRCVARWIDRGADWSAFPEAHREGYRRAQHRSVGGGGSGKHDDPGEVIPAGSFNVSVMGQVAGDRLGDVGDLNR